MENSGLNHMIKNDKYEEIRLMHELFSKVPEAFISMKIHLANYIDSEGGKLVADLQLKPDEFVTKIIQLRDKILAIYVKSFNKDSNIDLTIKSGFE